MVTSLTCLVDYSIHYFEPHNLLIAHMRYIGNDFEKDMEGIKESEATRRWWKVSRAIYTFLTSASSDE
jgi:L-rhamnose mutarotase